MTAYLPYLVTGDYYQLEEAYYRMVVGEKGPRGEPVVYEGWQTLGRENARDDAHDDSHDPGEPQK